MAIDRIGKGGNVPQVPDTGAATGAQKTGATFKVDRGEAVTGADHTTQASQAAKTDKLEGASATSPLARLRAGEVDVNGYVDLKVDEATKGLHGVPPADLAEIKNVLRDQMRTDPGLADLVRTATGKMPSPPSEEE